MAAPVPPRSVPSIAAEPRNEDPQRPQPTALQAKHEVTADSTATLRPGAAAAAAAAAAGLQPAPKKKRNHRGGKKKRARRQSFAATTEDGNDLPGSSRSLRPGTTDAATRSGFYRAQGRNLSNTSLESEALLDHRDQPSMRPRRSSTMGQSGAFGMPMYEGASSYRPQYQNPFVSSETVNRRAQEDVRDNGNESAAEDEQAPLLSRGKSSSTIQRYGANGGEGTTQGGPSSRFRRPSSRSSTNSRHKATIFDRQSPAFPPTNEEYNVNYPPSMPGSPTLAAANRDMSFSDMMVRDDFDAAKSSLGLGLDDIGEQVIEDETGPQDRDVEYERRQTQAMQAAEDVCFPVEGLSEMADEDLPPQEGGAYRRGPESRRRRRKWPVLSALEEYSRFEKAQKDAERGAKRITEPTLINGRLRPTNKGGWHRVEEEVPGKFCYFNEELEGTIHSSTISDLVQPGGSFRDLFIPDPPELSDSSESEEDFESGQNDAMFRHVDGPIGESRTPTRQGSMADYPRPDSRITNSVSGREEKLDSKESSGQATPSNVKSPSLRGTNSPQQQYEKPKRYGDRPTWWLDVLCPTDVEMKALSKAFGIHPLTAEDIMVQEAREKVELFRNYYFVNYRSFEQDTHRDDFLQPINIYVIVFREGVLSFHFSHTPHPAQVRRRIRQLKHYLILSSDWISYALVDDITDAFAPLIRSIENEVDDIDDEVLQLHSPKEEEYSERTSENQEKRSEADEGTKSGQRNGDMLRRVGDCRKKVMGLYRLLGNKADVIKGFAKRCNEHWEVAPRSEIGLYLGDIQDHIVTMTGNLSHYEKILARSHGNYLAQINIRMNERQEETADVLGKLTVLGTIVLPMNIITGLWGMNVWVPGQSAEGDLTWFFVLTASLLIFGISCFFAARWLYKIV